MLFLPGDRVYVDESKQHGYVLAATAIAPGARVPVNQALRGSLLGGQRRTHFAKESDSRRRFLLSLMSSLDVRAAVLTVPRHNDNAARAACISELVDLLAKAPVHSLTIERDETLEAADRAVIALTLQRATIQSSLRYEHVEPHAAPGLWISDAVAWSFARGGDWRRRVEPILGNRVTRL